MLFWAALSVYWGTQMAVGVPDAYRGQHRGGLLLCIASLILCVAQMVSSPRWRHALIIAMFLPLAAAVYFVGPFGG